MLESDIQLLKDFLLAATIAIIRLGAILNVVPFFGKQVIQGIPRNAVILSLSFLIIPMVLPAVPEEGLPLLSLVAIITKETFLGFIMGFLVGIPFWIVEGVGFFVDNQRGSAMASSFDPMVGATATPFGMLFVKIAVVLFFSTGGLFALLQVVYASYIIWPPFSFFPTIHANFPLFFLQEADFFIDHVLLFVSPILICMFLTDFGLGLVNCFAPQLNVFFLSMPIKSALACFILITYLYVLIFFFKEDFAHSNQMIRFLEQLFA